MLWGFSASVWFSYTFGLHSTAVTSVTEAEGHPILWNGFSTSSATVESAKGGEAVGDAEEEDQSNDAAVGCPCPGNDVVEPRVMAGG